MIIDFLHTLNNRYIKDKVMRDIIEFIRNEYAHIYNCCEEILPGNIIDLNNLPNRNILIHFIYIFNIYSKGGYKPLYEKLNNLIRSEYINISNLDLLYKYENGNIVNVESEEIYNKIKNII